ncbi:hypothetical protein HHL16_07920 [Pseudoflavitalea sp. G-6-1-2]|uniref:MBG domain-containing protein n=1 Tax=Pseudoflavitalea sp. G-6-1-2 TaxID=2728841 RepID=UPI00146EA5CC|nr:MBG domain-containing protein [Pseudoflavitalea sp. G-6-1-2]NML20796.1 hypothetical protein [Pseudoflavitalea sp. G-6-1-2]
MTSANLYAQNPDVNGIFYVKKGGTGNQRGDSWDNAIAELAIALQKARVYNASTPGTVKQIWVSGGTYSPMYAIDAGPTPTPSFTNRNNSFHLTKDVKVYGGFAGTEGSPADRNLSLTANASILSGDLGVAINNSDNAYHVVTAAGPMGTALLDGFTITKGFANGGSSYVTVNGQDFYLFNGGGIYLNGSLVPLSNLIISGNFADNYGVGVCITEAVDFPITNTIISGNAGGNYGAGIGLGHTSMILTNVVISGNRTSNGGGIHAYNGCSITINNSVIHGNSSGIGSSPGSNGDNTVNVQYSLVQGMAADATKHILDPAVDPLFANAPSYSSAPFSNANYKLGLNSPLINTGNNSLHPGLSAGSKDLEGGVRVTDYSTGGIIDIGAYEVQTQTITAAHHVKSYGNADFEPGATTTSNLPLSYSSADNSIAQPYQDAADGNKWKIKILKAGVVLITASQAGGAGYYSASKSFTVNISKATLLARANNASKVYDGLPFSGGNGVTYTGFKNNETAAALTGTLSYTGTSQGAINANIYLITPGGLSSDNYDITFMNGVLNLSKAILTVKANDVSKVYDGLAYSGGNGVSYTGFVNNETAAVLTGTLTYGGTSQGAVDVNNYVITPAGLSSGNYAINYAGGSLTISKANLMITANNAAKVYDGVAYSGGNGVTYAGFVNGESAAVLNGTVTYNGTSQGATNVNNYVITPGGLSSGNYAISYTNGSLTISKAALAVKANDASKVYDGLAYNGGNGVTYSGFVNNETAAALTGTLSYNGTSQGAINANSYTIVPGGLSSGNYDISYIAGSLTISKAALVIVADAQTKVYGTADPAFTYTVTSYASGDNQSIFSGGASRVAGENVGIYLINRGTLNAGNNYDISFTGNNLTITKASQTITWTQSLITGCNGAVSIALSATASSGLPVTYTTGNASIATVSGSTLTPLNAGSTLITAMQSGDENHFAAAPAINTFTYQSPSKVRQHWNDVLLFDNTDNNFAQWQWYKNGTAVPGATMGYYSETTALNGTYYTIATDKNGNVIQTCPLSLNGSNSAKEGIKVFPNPGAGGSTAKVTCNFDQSVLAGARLMISASNGTIVQQITTVQPVTSIILPMNGGIYSITLLLSNGQKATVNVLVK